MAGRNDLRGRLIELEAEIGDARTERGKVEILEREAADVRQRIRDAELQQQLQTNLERQGAARERARGSVSDFQDIVRAILDELVKMRPVRSQLYEFERTLRTLQIQAKALTTSDWDERYRFEREALLRVDVDLAEWNGLPGLAQEDVRLLSEMVQQLAPG